MRDHDLGVRGVDVLDVERERFTNATSGASEDPEESTLLIRRRRLVRTWESLQLHVGLRFVFVAAMPSTMQGVDGISCIFTARIITMERTLYRWAFDGEPWGVPR